MQGFRFSTVAGFTLIELMVTLTIFMVAILASLPVANSWNETSKIASAKGTLLGGVRAAQSSAQRNIGLNTSMQVSSVLCVDDGRLFVKAGAAGVEPECDDSSETVFDAGLPDGVLVETMQSANDSKRLSCVCYQPSGRRTTAGKCRTCSMSSDFKITTGKSSLEYTLH